MAEERRFSLSMTFKNIKDNKITVMFVLGLVVTVGLYVVYPVFMINAATKITDDVGLILGRNISGSFTEPPDTHTTDINDLPVKFNFTSVHTPQPCLEENVLRLGENVYLSICNIKNNNDGNVIVDIRKFTGNVKTGLNPTLVGINPNIHQWNVIKSSATIIDNIVIDLSSQDDV
jgi:hypothetical protein